MQEPSIFTKIIRGEIPSYKVYEDELTIAFMDIHPIQPGNVLVVPKAQVENFFDLSPEYYAAFMDTVKKVGARLHQVYPEKRRIGVQIEGLDVPHVHAKLFPIDSGKEFHAMQDTNQEPDHEQLAALARELAF
jgi:histidine triad (HIT) family protein